MMTVVTSPQGLDPVQELTYVLVKEQKEYEPQSPAQYEAKQQARTVQKLTKQAVALGYELRAVESGT